MKNQGSLHWLVMVIFIAFMVVGCEDKGSKMLTEPESGAPTAAGEPEEDQAGGPTIPWLGTKLIGDAAMQMANGITLDDSGMIYIAGGDRGRGKLIVLKPSGEEFWSRIYNPDGRSAGAEDVAVAADGLVYVVGYTMNAAGQQDVFVSKHEPNGRQIKEIKFGSFEGREDFPRAVTIGADGNIYIVGATAGSIEAPDTHRNMLDAFLVQLNPELEIIKRYQIGTDRNDYGNGVAVDKSGNVFVIGVTEGDIDDSGPAAFAGATDLFVAAYRTDGTRQFIQNGTAEPEYARGIAIDGSGNIYVAGMTNGNMDGTGNRGGDDILVIKYRSDLSVEWKRQWGSAENDTALAIVADESGNVYVAGNTDGDTEGVSAGMSDIVVFKYGADVATINQLGSDKVDQATGIALDKQGNVYVAGFTFGDFDGKTNQGGSDIFVVKYNSELLKQ